MLYREQTFAPRAFHSELQQQTNTVNTQKNPPWACGKGCAEACAERISALKPTPTFEVPSLRVSWLERKFIICSIFCIAIVYVSIGEETLLYGFRGKSISADVHGVSTSCELLNWDCSRRPHNFAHAGKYPSLKFRGCLHGGRKILVPGRS